jgi:hypothetical protein
MKKCLLFLLIALSSIPSRSQSNQSWTKGSIVLSTNQVLVGEIMVHLDYHTLVFRSSNHFEVFPSYKVKSFRYYDDKQNINRQFMTLGVSPKAMATFYEIVVKGQYSIVRSLTRYHSGGVNDKEDYSYFILHERNLIPIRQFKKKVFPELVNARPQLNQWLAAERLDLNTEKAAILMIKEFNRSYFTEMVAAR